MEFNIITLPVGQMQSNCYLLIAENRDCLIVDPGDDGDYLERIIADHRAKPLTILATHGHFDHIMAVTELKLAYNIPFLINQKDEFLVKNMRQSAGHFLGIQTDPPPDADNFLQENEIIALGGHKIRVIGTPGHTPGSVCLYLEKEKCLISGDTLFAYYTFTGTNSGMMMGMPPTNKSVSVNGVDIVVFKDGKAVEHWEVSDNLGMMKQLGMMPGM